MTYLQQLWILLKKKQVVFIFNSQLTSFYRRNCQSGYDAFWKILWEGLLGKRTYFRAKCILMTNGLLVIIDARATAGIYIVVEMDTKICSFV